MDKVRAKKHLGQHFLKDLNISRDIAELLTLHGSYRKVLEIGPGMGVLTQYLLPNSSIETHVVEIDTESVVYLSKNYPDLIPRIYGEDFLKMDISQTLNLQSEEKIAIIGNFPYNISSQIFFKVLEIKDQVTEVVCMLQKEVAQRIASPPGKKDYGILSVLLQAYYDIEYCFTVYPEAFNPPPKVDSGVIRLRRNANLKLDCNEARFVMVVKAGFNQRRKKLSNALSHFGKDKPHPLLDKRAEQLTYHEFVELTNLFFPRA